MGAQLLSKALLLTFHSYQNDKDVISVPWILFWTSRGLNVNFLTFLHSCTWFHFCCIWNLDWKKDMQIFSFKVCWSLFLLPFLGKWNLLGKCANPYYINCQQTDKNIKAKIVEIEGPVNSFGLNGSWNGLNCCLLCFCPSSVTKKAYRIPSFFLQG